MYTPLRNKTHYSLLLGRSKPKEIANKMAELGYKSCAITDHGSISGSIQFAKAMKEKGIKPIFGCDILTTELDSTNKTLTNKTITGLPMICKNKNGWLDMLKLVSESNKYENYLDHPRIDLEKLSKFSNGNFIGFSGGYDTHLYNAVIKGTAERTLKKLLDIFGKENFFIESQLVETDINVVEQLRSLAKKNNIKCVATPNPHYTNREDADDQRVLLCSKMNLSMLNGVNTEFARFFKTPAFFLPAYEEMLELGYSVEELENTLYIDSLCDSFTVLRQPVLPKFDCPNGMNVDEYLRQLCRDGWSTKAKHVKKEDYPKYGDRVKEELRVLQGAGLSAYFLIVRDIIQYVKSTGNIVGPGRGCFLPDTRVKMSDGYHKPISMIEKGDKVIDAFGDIQEVYDTLEYDVDEELLEIEFENGKIIRCTKDHKFLTNNRGWVEAQYLTEEDDIVEV